MPFNPFNGYLVPLLLWAVNGLLALVMLLLGFLLKEHQRQDEKNRQADKETNDEHRRRMEGEIMALRQRAHEYGNKITMALARLDWLDEGGPERRREPHG